MAASSSGSTIGPPDRKIRLGPLVGAVDQGTTSTRFLVFVASTGELVTYHQVPVVTNSPKSGWLEVDPNSLVTSVIECINATVRNLEALDVDPSDIVTVGITSLREAAFAWDKRTGRPWSRDAPGILGQDVRAQSVVEELTGKGRKPLLSSERIRAVSGIPVSCHFAATKYRWMLTNVEQLKDAHDEKRLLLGTADSFLIWNLTNHSDEGGGIHMTDVTHASLTGLMNLENLKWDPILCNFYGVPIDALPKIKSCSEVYGHLTVSSLQGVPISGCIGDQQAALVGQNCWRPGQAKSTFGSGSFTLYNAGPRIVHSDRGLLSVVAYQLGKGESPVYALEGSVGVSGSAVDWLKSNAGMIEDVSQVETLAGEVKDSQGVFFVPSFAGHQSPLWAPHARGILVGLTQHSKKSHICRAALEAVAFQTRDVLEAMQADSSSELSSLLVDGGMSSNNLLMQIQADILGIPVLRPSMHEASALGAAAVAGLAKGIDVWVLRASPNLTLDKFLPRMTADEREVRHEKWKDAVSRSLNWVQDSADECGGSTTGDRSLTKVMTRREHRLASSLSPAIFFFTSFALWKISDSLE